MLVNILNMHAETTSRTELFNWLLDDERQKYGSYSKNPILIKKNMVCRAHFTSTFLVTQMLHVTNDQKEILHNSVHNPIPTQILTEIDSMDNILAIGATNIIKVIDPALYRLGRLDILNEIGLPDQEGRSDVFSIGTKALLTNFLISADVNVGCLVHETHGMTGAHIEELVRRAVPLNHGTRPAELSNTVYFR